MEMTELPDGLLYHARQGGDIQQVRLHGAGRIGTLLVQFGTQSLRILQRDMTMDCDVRACRMQTAYDSRANALCPACHQYCFALHRIPH